LVVDALQAAVVFRVYAVKSGPICEGEGGCSARMRS